MGESWPRGNRGGRCVASGSVEVSASIETLALIEALAFVGHDVGKSVVSPVGIIGLR
jgi:hypothetical protein